MKCSIIRDLLPLYCDKLTSADSNEEIENHLRSCTECAEIYENMSKEEITMPEQDKNIKPLKKVKKSFTKRLIIGISSGTVILVGLFLIMFVGVIPISSSDLIRNAVIKEQYLYNCDIDENGEEISGTTTKEPHQFLQINFKSKFPAFRIKNDCDVDMKNGKMVLKHKLTFYPVLFGSKNYTLSFDVSDKNNSDTLTIHCRDKDVVINVAELYEQKKGT